MRFKRSIDAEEDDTRYRIYASLGNLYKRYILYHRYPGIVEKN